MSRSPGHSKVKYVVTTIIIIIIVKTITTTMHTRVYKYEKRRNQKKK